MNSISQLSLDQIIEAERKAGVCDSISVRRALLKGLPIREAKARLEQIKSKGMANNQPTRKEFWSSDTPRS